MGFWSKLRIWMFGLNNKEFIGDRAKGNRRTILEQAGMVHSITPIDKNKIKVKLNMKGGGGTIILEAPKTGEISAQELANQICIGGIVSPGVYNATMFAKGAKVDVGFSVGQKMEAGKVRVGGGADLTVGGGICSEMALGSYYHGRKILRYRSSTPIMRGNLSFPLVTYATRGWRKTVSTSVSAEIGLTAHTGHTGATDGPLTTGGFYSAKAARHNSGLEYQLFRADVKLLNAKAGGSARFTWVKHIALEPAFYSRKAFEVKKGAVTRDIGLDFSKFLGMNVSGKQVRFLEDEAFIAPKGVTPVLLSLRVQDKELQAEATLASAQMTIGCLGYTDYSKGSAGGDLLEFGVSLAQAKKKKAWKIVKSTMHFPFSTLQKDSLKLNRYYKSYQLVQQFEATQWSWGLFQFGAKAVRLGLEPGVLIAGKASSAGQQQYGRNVLTPADAFSYAKIQDCDLLGLKEMVDSYLGKMTDKFSRQAPVKGGTCQNYSMGYHFSVLGYKVPEGFRKKEGNGNIHDVVLGKGISIDAESMNHIVRCIKGLRAGHTDKQIMQFLLEPVSYLARSERQEAVAKIEQMGSTRTLKEFKNATSLGKLRRRSKSLKKIDDVIGHLHAAVENVHLECNRFAQGEFKQAQLGSLGAALEQAYLLAFDCMAAFRGYADGKIKKHELQMERKMSVPGVFERLYETKKSTRLRKKDAKEAMTSTYESACRVLEFIGSPQIGNILGWYHLVHAYGLVHMQAEQLTVGTETTTGLTKKMVKEYIAAAETLEDINDDETLNASGFLLEVGYNAGRPSTLARLEAREIENEDETFELLKPDYDILVKEVRQIRYLAFRWRISDKYDFNRTLFKVGMDFGVFGGSLKLITEKNYRSESCVDIHKKVYLNTDTENVHTCPMTGFGQ